MWPIDCKSGHEIWLCRPWCACSVNGITRSVSVSVNGITRSVSGSVNGITRSVSVHLCVAYGL